MLQQYTCAHITKDINGVVSDICSVGINVVISWLKAGIGRTGLGARTGHWIRFMLAAQFITGINNTLGQNDQQKRVKCGCKNSKNTMNRSTSYDLCYRMLIDNSYECVPVCLLDVVGWRLNRWTSPFKLTIMSIATLKSPASFSFFSSKLTILVLASVNSFSNRPRNSVSWSVCWLKTPSSRSSLASSSYFIKKIMKN